MTALITAFEPARCFVDEQVRGPCRLWRHEHGFEPDGSGGTVMRDVIEFPSPFGQFVLDRYMPRLIRQRNEHLKRVAEAS